MHIAVIIAICLFGVCALILIAIVIDLCWAWVKRRRRNRRRTLVSGLYLCDPYLYGGSYWDPQSQQYYRHGLSFSSLYERDGSTSHQMSPTSNLAPYHSKSRTLVPDKGHTPTSHTGHSQSSHANQPSTQYTSHVPMLHIGHQPIPHTSHATNPHTSHTLNPHTSHTANQPIGLIQPPQGSHISTSHSSLSINHQTNPTTSHTSVPRPKRT